VLNYFEDGNEADVVFLDIIMPVMYGTELAEKLREFGWNGYIILLSSSNYYAEQSYRINAFSYLIKPPVINEVQKVFNRITADRNDPVNSRFKLTVRGAAPYIKYGDLMYVEVRNHHIYFCLRNGEVIKVYGKISDYAAVLYADPRMVRGNRSYILNMDYIASCVNGAVIMDGGTRISIPKGYGEFTERYLEWMMNKD
jgi:DNA-binding LytR/AlgR family response regulator